jgi:sugar transferase (PEP-CTERM/EpsH1 system associated)
MKRRLLILTPRWPYPPIGGDRLRIYQICRHLARDFELSLLSLCEREEDMDSALPTDGTFARVERVFHDPWRRAWGMVTALPGDLPMQAGYYRNRAFARRVRALAPTHDALLAHLVRMAPYILEYRLPRIVEMTDAISLSYTRTAEHARGARRLAWNAEAGRLARYERRVIQACDQTVLVSDVDRDWLQLKHERPKVLVCGNGVDTQALRFDYAPDGRTIAFIGNNLAQHNADSILWFAREALPAIRARLPQAIFKVIGEIRPELAERLRRMGVTVTGRVAEMREATRHATVGVCPLRFGAGVQNKLLEYMALGIPAVTSPIGLEGLSAVPGKHLEVASTPREWAQQVAALLEQPALGRAYACAARQYVQDHHSWSAHLAPLSEAIQRLTGGGFQADERGAGAMAPASDAALPAKRAL